MAITDNNMAGWAKRTAEVLDGWNTNGMPVGTSATSLGKAVDSVAGATDTGIAALFVRRDTPTTLTPADGDYARGGLDSLGNVRTREYYAPAAEDNTAGIYKTEQQVSYANITADTAVVSGAGRFFGFIVNSHSSGTIKVWDNTSAATTVLLNTITLAAGPQQWVFPVGIRFTTGLFVDIGGTIDVTVLYKV